MLTQKDKKILYRLKDVLAGLYDQYHIGVDPCFFEAIDRVIDGSMNGVKKMQRLEKETARQGQILTAISGLLYNREGEKDGV